MEISGHYVFSNKDFLNIKKKYIGVDVVVKEKIEQRINEILNEECNKK